jgi:hypothetical protein
VFAASNSWTYIGAAASIVAIVAAVIGLAAWVRARWRATIGRRREHYGRLTRLGANAQVSFFTAVLQSPPALQRSFMAPLTSLPELAGDRSFEAAYHNRVALFMTQLAPEDFDAVANMPQPPAAEVELVRVETQLAEVVWIDRDYYVQAIADEDETVLAFSVTTRSARFNPRFAMPPGVRWRQRTRFAKWLRVLPGDVAIFNIKLGRSRFSVLPRPRTVYA